MLAGQKQLFDAETAPYSEPTTSRAAAEAILPSVETLRREVYEHILACGETGSTDSECQEHLNMAGNTQRPRRRELEQSGHVVRTERTRPTSSGRRASVWVAKRFAEAQQ